MSDPFDEFDKIFRHMQNITNTQFSGAYKYNNRKQSTRQIDNLIVDSDKHKMYFTLELRPINNKEDILVNVTQNTLSLTVLLNGQEGRDTINLPANVKPKTTKTTFVNGILDVEMDIETP